MKNIVLSDGDYDEMIPFMEGLNSKNDFPKYTLIIHKANWVRTGKISEFRRFFKYFVIPFKYFILRNRYNVIMGWQQFYALIFCFYCSVFHVKKRNKVVAVNVVYKEKSGLLRKVYRWFAGKCINPLYLDYIVVSSYSHAELINKEFNYPMDRIIAIPFGVKDDYDRFNNIECPKGMKKNEFILSIGRSNRDYDFLIDAWKEIDCPLVIISDTYKKNQDVKNVIIKNDIAGDEQYPWIVNSKAIIIPIDDPLLSSGDTVLLQAMSLKKIIVVTTPSALSDMYIINKENGLTISKDANLLKEMVEDIMAGEYDYVSENARACFLEKYTRYKMAESIVKGIM